MQFNRIIGNGNAIRTLQNAANGGPLNHAYLLHGTKGTGKRTLARIFAETILCRGENRPCGSCAACLKVEKGIHPDLMQMVRMLQPTPEGIPVEVYCFTRETDWVAYEAVQGAVFDHLFAVLPDFGLRAYQRSSDREPQSSES